MPNPYAMTADIEIGPVTLTFQVPGAADHSAWDALAAGQDEQTQEKVTDLLWSLLRSTKIDGKPGPEDWEEQLRESGLLHGPNGIGVGVKLFRFPTVKAVVVGLD